MDKEFKKLFEDIENVYYKATEIENWQNTPHDPYFKTDYLKKKLLELYCYANEPLKTTKKLKKDEYTIYRGVHDITAKKYIKLLKNGTFEFFRKGILGLGCYFSDNYFYSLEHYANDKQKGMVYANMKKDIEFAMTRKTYDLYNEFLKQIKDPTNNLNPQIVDFIYDRKSDPFFQTIVARTKEIDVITENGLRKESLCIINPQKITILDK